MCTNRTSPECPKHPVQPLHHTLVIFWRKPEVSIPIPVKVPPVFKTGLQAAAIRLPFFIVVSAGVEPTHPEPKSGALPLGYETINKANMSKNFFF